MPWHFVPLQICFFQPGKRVTILLLIVVHAFGLEIPNYLFIALAILPMIFEIYCLTSQLLGGPIGSSREGSLLEPMAAGGHETAQLNLKDPTKHTLSQVVGFFFATTSNVDDLFQRTTNGKTFDDDDDE